MSWTQNSKRFCVWVTVVIAEPIWASSKRFCARVAVVIAGLSLLKGSKRFGFIISELSLQSRKRLVAYVTGFKTLEFICAVVVAET